MLFLLPLGTRPEALKAIAIVKVLRERHHTAFIIATNQDGAAAASALQEYGIETDEFLRDDYPSTLAEQLEQLTANLTSLFHRRSPDAVVVIGDTSTAFAAASAAANAGFFLVHIEAGLRTSTMNSPFPEEFFRRSISRLANFHLAPTNAEKRNLLKEGVPNDAVFVAPNTIYSLAANSPFKSGQKKNIVLASCHRREIGDDDVDALLEVLQQTARTHSDLAFLFIVHRRHNSRRTELVTRFANITFLPPQSHHRLLDLLSRSVLVLTDSGGLQEEASFCGTATIVLRNTTDRSHLIDGHLRVMAGAPSSPEAQSHLKEILRGMLLILQKDVELP